MSENTTITIDRLQASALEIFTTLDVSASGAFEARANLYTRNNESIEQYDFF